MPKLIKKVTTIDKHIEDFMVYCEFKELSRKTMESYEKTLKLFARYLEEELQVIDIKMITEEHIEDYIKFTKERGKYSFVSNDKTTIINNPQARQDFGDKVSNTTINNYIRNMKVFFNYCVDKRIIKYSPVKVNFLKNERKPKDEITNEDFKKIVRVVDTTRFYGFRDYTIIQLIMDTGMRISETLDLTLDDVYLEQRYIIIPAEITKSKRERAVFFGNTMASLLRRWIEYKDRYCDNDELLFCTKKGTKLGIRNFETNFKKYVNTSGVEKDISPHGLRNNFARRFLMAGGDIYTLSKILGHSSITVTEKAYLDLTVSNLRKNYSRFSPIEEISKGGSR